MPQVKRLSEPQLWLMDYLAHRYGCTAVAEFKFHPKRRWKFDVALPYHRIAVEVEGGAWTNGRHTRGKGFLSDMEKYNTAHAMGWRVFRFTPQQVLKGKVKEFCEEYL